MSKLNPSTRGSGKKNPESETRLAGGGGLKAAVQDDLSQLERCVLANMLWEDNAYQDGQLIADQIRKLVPKCSGLDVATLAVKARKEQKLRHTPLFLAALMCKTHKEHVQATLNEIITRPDQLTDFLAIYKKEREKDGKKGLKPIANAAKKGLALCFNKFNEYQFAKYDRDGEIKLRDVMRLTHPVPLEGQEELFKKIRERTLTPPDTWEVALSAGKDKRETWTRLIEEGKLGSLAFLRNLRNMKDVHVDANVIKKGLKEIKPYMLLPLNFFAAVKHAPEFKADIQELMFKTYAGLPKLPGLTAMVIDCSGSMNAAVSTKSQYTRLEVAQAMAVVGQFSCEKLDIWGTATKWEKLPYPSSGFDLVEQMQQWDYMGKRSLGSGGIYTRRTLETMRGHYGNTIPDRIMIFSDSQDCDSPGSGKPAPFGKNNYIIDVGAHTHGINYRGIWTAEISGMSEHFLQYVAAYEGISNVFEEE